MPQDKQAAREVCVCVCPGQLSRKAQHRASRGSLAMVLHWDQDSEWAAQCRYATDPGGLS